MTGIQYLNFIADVFGVQRGRIGRSASAKYAELFRADRRSGAAHRRLFPRHEAEAGHYFRLASTSPKLIMMDEPFVGLDPKAAHLLKGMMRELCDRGGAIFFSTHVLEVAEKLCDKVAIIKGGKLIRSGTMEEVKGDDSLEEVFLELEGETMLKHTAEKADGGNLPQLFCTTPRRARSALTGTVILYFALFVCC